MKKTKQRNNKKSIFFAVLLLSVAAIFAGCRTSKTAKGTSGEAAGDALIGHKMDKQKEELTKIQGAQVESANEGRAIKVTFDSGILFAVNSSTLNQTAKNMLTQFANSLQANLDTDIQIYGHTDSSGNDLINIP
jgi:outer membrane protein OmpA-like peptidoglycan-associated protein